MIINAFLRWAETARAGDRAQAAHALARAYSRSRIAPDDRNAAEMAMIFLLDDPAPRVRLALADGRAHEIEIGKRRTDLFDEMLPRIARKIRPFQKQMADIGVAAQPFGDALQASARNHRPLVFQQR